MKRSKCPNCKRLFCFQCKLSWHAGFRCEESGDLRDRDDTAVGVLVERKNWKRCPQCHHFVELIEGCRIIKCRFTLSLSLPRTVGHTQELGFNFTFASELGISFG